MNKQILKDTKEIAKDNNLKIIEIKEIGENTTYIKMKEDNFHNSMNNKTKEGG